MATETNRPKRLSQSQWQALITEQQNGSATQSEFFRFKGLCLSTFYNWKKKLNNNDKPSEQKAPNFIELPVASEPLPKQAWDIELEFPGNVILRMRR